MARIIAEIGLHHWQSRRRALQLISAAVDSGATDVKFQYFTAPDLAGRPQSCGWHALWKYALKAEHLNGLREAANKLGARFGCSFFGLDGVRTFRDAGGRLDWAKVPAPLAVDDAVTDAVRELGVPLVRSFYGTATFAGIVAGDTLLHCTSAYPTPDGELLLDRIARLPAASEFRGWSCHAVPRDGDTVRLAMKARAYGAGVFEFHFRDHDVPEQSFDYGVSVWPELLRAVADALRSS